MKSLIVYPFFTILFFLFLLPGASQAQGRWLSALTSPILFKGDEHTAYRDPAVLFYQQRLYMFFTLCKTGVDGKIYSYSAMSSTTDFKYWSVIKILAGKAAFIELTKA